MVIIYAESFLFVTLFNLLILISFLIPDILNLSVSVLRLNKNNFSQKVPLWLKKKIENTTKSFSGFLTPAEQESGIRKLLRCQLEERFLRNFQICPLTLKLGIKGFLDIGNTNIAIKNVRYIFECLHVVSNRGFLGLWNTNIALKNSPNKLSRVYGSIFPKNSISSA